MSYNRDLGTEFRVPVQDAGKRHSQGMMQVRTAGMYETPTERDVSDMAAMLKPGTWFQDVDATSPQVAEFQRLGAQIGTPKHNSGQMGFYVGPETDTEALAHSLLSGYTDRLGIEATFGRIRNGNFGKSGAGVNVNRHS